MRASPASPLRVIAGGRETGRNEPTDTSGLSMATGVYIGVALGLVFWLAVLGLAWAVWWLA